MRSPRLARGRRRELGVVNALLCRLLARGSGVREAHVFTALGRHRRLFRWWLAYSGALLAGGRLRRRETELVILRVAHRCDSAYEWDHHARLGRRAGLSPDEVERVRDADASTWSPADAALLNAVDHLICDDDLGDDAWTELREQWDERQAIELCLLVGHYRGLAATIRTLGLDVDRPR